MLFLMLSLSLNAQEDDLNSLVIVTGNYPPGIDGAKSDKGYISRIVSDAFALEGIKVKFLFLPWARGLRMVKMGKEVSIMYYAKTPERMKDFIFSDPIFEEEWLFFHLKKTKVEWRKLADLSRFNIGATLSYSYSDEFHELADKKVLNVNWVTRDKQNWQMLMAGRIDIFPNMQSSKYQIKALFNEADIAQITFHDKPLKKQLNYLLFSKQHPNSVYFKDKFNQGFTKLKKRRPLSFYIPNSENKDWPH
jgi:polar amino acid transport system substrate-binding protein